MPQPEWDWYTVTLAVNVRVPHGRFSQGEDALMDAIADELKEAVEKVNGVEAAEVMDWEFEQAEEAEPA